MSAPIDDGGPAFPCIPPDPNPAAYSQFPSSIGMTLRDWFAGHATDADIKACWPEDDKLRTVPEHAARARYIFADAMLAARKEAK
jgi:hypothetical protein